MVASEFERHHAIEPLAEAWDELATRVDAVPWLRPSWVGAWWHAFGQGSLEVLAVRRGERLTAVLPLVRRGRTFSSPTNWHTPEFGLLVQDEQAAGEIVRAALALRPHRLDLAFLGVGAREVEAAASSGGYRLLTRPLMRSPYVDLGGSWAEYTRAHEGKRARELRRLRRSLEAEGRVELEVADGRERLDVLLEEGFEVEHSGWKLANGTAIVSHPETRRFYSEVARWAAESGWLRLFFLRLDGRPIAFELTLEAEGSLFDLKGGIDPEFRRYSPGIQIVREMLEYSFARRLRSFEFLGTEEPYKLGWSNGVRERILLQAFPPTPAGIAQRAALVYGRPLAKRAVALIRR